MVGNNPASKIYVNMKKKACKKVGFRYTQVDLPENSSENEIIRHINYLNYTNDIHGILVQLPLPKHINERKILDTVRVEKDADCFHTLNFGKLSLTDNNTILYSRYTYYFDNYNIEKRKNITIIGGNSWLQYLYYFLKRGQQYRYVHKTQSFGLQKQLI